MKLLEVIFQTIFGLVNESHLGVSKEGVLLKFIYIYMYIVTWRRVLDVLDEYGFAAEDLAQVYNKNCMNRHVVLFL